MPHATLKLIPGVDTNKTPTLNEMAVSYTTLVRFVPDRTGLGLIQKIGGWTQFIAGSFPAPVRALKAWSDLEYTKYLAIGGERNVGVQVYREADQSLLDVTPRTIVADVLSAFVTLGGTGIGYEANNHTAVVAATTANLTATYNNGTSGVGATLTNSGTQAALSIDGISLSAGQRVLVKDQTTASQNGVYTVTTVGSGSTNWALTRATDFDQWGTNDIEYGAAFLVTSGTVNASRYYYCVNYTTVTVGSTSITFYRGFGMTTSPGSSSVTFYTTDVPSAASYIYFPTIINIGNVNILGPYDILTIGEDFLTFVVPDLLVPISKVTSTGSGTRTVTVNFSQPHTFYAGQKVYVSGVTDTSFNGTFTIASVTEYSITYTQSGSAANSDGGTVNAAVTLGGAPPFYTTDGTTTVTVTLTNHGYSVGDTFNAPVPTNVGGTTVSGLYTVNDTNGANQFEISVDSPATTFSTTSTSGDGTTATVSISNTSYVVPVNTYVTIAGVTPSGYNGTVVVTSSFPGYFSYASSATGSQTVAGTVTMPVSAYENAGSIRVEQFVSLVSSNRGDNYFYGGGIYGEGLYGSGAIPAADQGEAIVGNDWTLDNWGSILVACPKNGPLYYWQPVGSSISNLSYMPNAPIANSGAFVAMPQRQVIAYGSSFGSIQDPLLVRWCDLEDFTVWQAQAINQAGSYRIPTGSKIVGGLQAAQQAILWTDIDVWSMTYIGQPYIYSFNKIGANAGLISQKAAGQMGGTVYWMSQKQFFRFAGNGVEVIPCPVWDQIFQNLYPGTDENGNPYIDRIRCAPNSQYNEITWYFPAYYTSGLDPADSLNIQNSLIGTGEVNAYVKYNVALNQWDYGYQDEENGNVLVGRTAWIDQSVLGPPIGVAASSSVGLNNGVAVDEYAPSVSRYATGSSSVATLYFSPVTRTFPPGTLINISEMTETEFDGNYEVTSSTTGKSSAVTITSASPAVVTWGGHNLSANSPVYFTTTESMPVGLVAGTIYFVKTVVSVNQFTVSYTVGGAAINTTSTGSGVITCYSPSSVTMANANFASTSLTDRTFGVIRYQEFSYVYQHETSNNANNYAIDSGFTTGYAALAEGDQMTFIDQVWPDMKWSFVDSQRNATVNVTFYVTNYPGQEPIQYGPYAVTQDTEYLSVRMRGRLISISVSSSDLNSFWRIGAMRYRFQPDGKY